MRNTCNNLHLDQKNKIVIKIIRKICKIKIEQEKSGIFENKWEHFDISLAIIWIYLKIILKII